MKKMLMLASLMLPPLLAVAAPQKKVILTGFSSLTPAQLRAHAAEAEKAVPADGILIHLDYKTTVNGKFFQAYRHSVFSGVNWKAEWLKQSIEDIKAAKLKQFTDNFVYIATTDCNFDLFDDTGWKSACHNAHVLADFAKKAGLKGIFWDVEHYGGEKFWPIFKFNPSGKHTFAECEAQARKRGREFMNAISSAFPDVRIIAVLGSYNINFPVLDAIEPRRLLEEKLYGLSPAFFDGMFEVLPPKARIYDGTELYGYLAKTPQDYYKLVHDFWTRTPQLCAPELRNKILCQSGIAMPMYMECYTNKKGFWRVSSPHMDQVKLFRRNLFYALQASDEYAWIYYDAAAKWYSCTLGVYYENVLKKTGGGKAKLWQELLPGLEDAMRAAKDPRAFAHARIAAGKMEVVRRFDFEDGKLSVTPWSSGNAGKIAVDPATGAGGSKKSASFKGVKSGSIHCKIPACPGDLYLLRAKAKKFRPENSITLSAQFGNGTTLETNFGKPGKDGWQQAELVVFIPDDAKGLELHCGAGSKRPEGSDCRFDDIEIIRIP